MILLIDSRDRETAWIGVAENGRLIHTRKVNIFGATNRILKTIQSMTAPTEITGVIVARGPGSFTAVRMGVVIANALAFALNVPLIGVRNSLPPSRQGLQKLAKVRPTKRGLTLPVYDRPPSITKRRR